MEFFFFFFTWMKTYTLVDKLNIICIKRASVYGCSFYSLKIVIGFSSPNSLESCEHSSCNGAVPFAEPQRRVLRHR